MDDDTDFCCEECGDTEATLQYDHISEEWLCHDCLPEDAALYYASLRDYRVATGESAE